MNLIKESKSHVIIRFLLRFFFTISLLDHINTCRNLIKESKSHVTIRFLLRFFFLFFLLLCFGFCGSSSSTRSSSSSSCTGTASRHRGHFLRSFGDQSVDVLASKLSDDDGCSFLVKRYSDAFQDFFQI